MAARGFKYLWVVLLAFLIRASTACTSYGVDYSNNGAYYIDGSSNEYFTFITVFQGKLLCGSSKPLGARRY